MEAIEVIERLMHVTGDWHTTLTLLEKHPLKKEPEPVKVIVAQPEPVKAVEAPKPEPEPVKAAPKPEPAPVAKGRGRRGGSIRDQILEALAEFPNSGLQEVITLIGKEQQDSGAVAGHLKRLFDQKLLIRQKNAKGQYTYRPSSMPAQ
jgi:hypothetical protein